MNSIDIYIVVEGPTERTFVRDVLAPELANKNIFLQASVIGKPGHKGGDIRFGRAAKDIGNFLKLRKDIYVSTMFDFFRIDPDWPGKKKIQGKIKGGRTLPAIRKAEILEGETYNGIVEQFSQYNAETRFIPYIEMHEFEALLFSDADILAEKTGINIVEIKKVIEAYDNPEEINEDPEKAPSKRLEKLKTGYRKVAMGKIISEAIGIQTIRNQCPHFNAWLTTLEELKEKASIK
ncbi:DUF4276 family protein [Desulfocicer niacini]